MCISVDAGPLTVSSRASTILVRYSMIRDSDRFFATSIHKYADWRHAVSSVSLTLGVTCENI